MQINDTTTGGIIRNISFIAGEKDEVFITEDEYGLKIRIKNVWQQIILTIPQAAMPEFYRLPKELAAAIEAASTRTEPAKPSITETRPDMLVDQTGEQCWECERGILDERKEHVYKSQEGTEGKCTAHQCSYCKGLYNIREVYYANDNRVSLEPNPF